MASSRVTHVCSGTCGAKITEKQYRRGLRVCGTKGCTHYGKPFKKVVS